MHAAPFGAERGTENHRESQRVLSPTHYTRTHTHRERGGRGGGGEGETERQQRDRETEREREEERPSLQSDQMTTDG